MSLSISAVSEAISRAAGPSSISLTSRPLRAASAKPTRCPIVEPSTGGSWSTSRSAVSRAMIVRAAAP